MCIRMWVRAGSSRSRKREMWGKPLCEERYQVPQEFVIDYLGEALLRVP